ncbi:MAG TPA: family 16 glycoside hydrolase [Candidatus Acidoferrales bacterium]
MIPNLQEGAFPAEVQNTTFSLDVLGRYICNTYAEAVHNGGSPFDAIILGAGMYGAYIAEKIFRQGKGNLRVLLLEAGPFLVSEHVQNLSRIGLNVPGPTTSDPGIARERVWGLPWRSNVGFPGLAYCVGGRSLYWGGWSPRLTDADLQNWPAALRSYLRDNYNRTEKETGVDPQTDFISGPLNDALQTATQAAAQNVATIGGVEAAPLAVQGAAPVPGLFAFDKYSSAPILIDAIREAAGDPDSTRRLFLVPRAHVIKLHAAGGVIQAVELDANGQRQFLPVTRDCAVVLALGTIESTRLALESFPTPLMGRNLMAHLRSNTTVRIPRAIFGALPQGLNPAALLVRGSTPEGRFHLQVTAVAADTPNSEATMWRMVPDLDLLEQLQASQQFDKITVTFRGIGEMTGDKNAVNTNPATSWIDLSPFERDEFGMPRAWVNLATTSREQRLWDAMDQAALKLAQAIARTPANIEYFYDGAWQKAAPAAAKVRDGLGTTHHEAGALWLGNDPNSSVVNLEGRFHFIENAYAAGPAVFPALGSANPSLTAFTLARRTAEAIVQKALPVPAPDQVSLINPTLDGWQMAGRGDFRIVGSDTVESEGGIGLLWYAKQQFSDFVLRVDWRASGLFDNSGVFLRFPALGNANPGEDWKLAVDQGYEIQIDDRGYDPLTNTTGSPTHMTGAVYSLAPAVKLASRPIGEWNTFEISAAGAGITVRLNGELVCEFRGDPARPLRGHIGLQNHHPGSRVQFRNLFVKAAATAAAAARGRR